LGGVLQSIADSQTISRHIRSERLHIASPPGVGKTEICNVFTDYLLGNDKLVRFDMSKYQTLESIYRLLGHNGEEGLLGLNYDRVDRNGTLLFDEIEKAHERALDLFLQLLSAARLTLGSGRVLNLEKFYVAATSNIGSPLLTRLWSGVSADALAPDLSIKCGAHLSC
jgi:ATP-dependent Clp protease ATP-binding subunit ClpA